VESNKDNKFKVYTMTIVSILISPPMILFMSAIAVMQLIF